MHAQELTPTDIAAIRTLMGLSVRQLADMLGIQHTTVMGWEKGKYRPGPGPSGDLLMLKLEHDQAVSDALADTTRGVPVVIRITDDRPKAWFLAIAARVMDRETSVAPVSLL